MIASLRRWHLGWFAVLAVLLPVLLWLALDARTSVPAVEALPQPIESRP